MTAADAPPAEQTPPAARVSLFARLTARLFAPVPAGPLAGLRIVFGLTIAYEAATYLRHGWPAALFEEPAFLFKYWGFEWVSPDWLPWSPTAHFWGLAALGLCLAAGLCYRLSAALLWAGFTLAFLWDATYYLNHFYLVCLLAFLFCWVPAHRAFSLDALLRPGRAAGAVPWWAVNLMRFQLAVVYVYGGIAKLNADWFAGRTAEFLVGTKTHVPLVGPFVGEPWAAPAVAWGGVAFDLLIVPAVIWRRTRLAALLAAAGFHVMNHYLFNIGIFPWLALLATCVLWPPGGSAGLTPLALLRLAVGLFALTLGLDAVGPGLGGPAGVDPADVPGWWVPWHLFGLAAGLLTVWPRARGLGVFLCAAVPAAAACSIALQHGTGWRGLVLPAGLTLAAGALAWPPAFLSKLRFGDAAELDDPPRPAAAPLPDDRPARWGRRATVGLLTAWVTVQLLMPLRHHLYPGDVAWTEEGHRWSWRMKLRIRRPGDEVGTWFEVDDAEGVPITAVFPRRQLPRPFLTPRQAKELRADPDMIVQFARHLAEYYEEQGRPAPVTVRCRCRVSLNGHPPAEFIDPTVDLAAADWPLGPKPWVLRENAPPAR